MRAAYGSLNNLSPEEYRVYRRAQHKKHYELNKDHIEDQRRNRPKTSLMSRLGHLCTNAKQRGIGYDIDKHFLKDLYESQGGLCAISGLPMTVGDDENRTWSMQVSLDRVDSFSGYYRDNVQLACAKMNYLRGNLPMDELISICRTISENHL